MNRAQRLREERSGILLQLLDLSPDSPLYSFLYALALDLRSKIRSCETPCG